MTEKRGDKKETKRRQKGDKKETKRETKRETKKEMYLRILIFRTFFLLNEPTPLSGMLHTSDRRQVGDSV
jgi:hypothetical protein